MRIEINGRNDHYFVDISGEKPEEMAAEYFHLDRKVLIISDDNIPETYYSTIESLCQEPYVVLIPHGEKHKGIMEYDYLLHFLTKHKFRRDDCIVAVGGGVVNDLAGFVAATYMRGIDYYSVPTTLLCQVDASVGGKTGINYEGYKNLVGAFYPPKAVAITSFVLDTLDNRQFSNGMAEIVKMAVCLNRGLFERLENVRDIEELRKDEIFLKKIIAESVLSKIKIIEKDEKEKDIRRILNFGHTIGHGVESFILEEKRGGKRLLHGECVAIGMIPMCGEKVKERLRRVLTAFNLPVKIPGGIRADILMKYIAHDKKTDRSGFNIVAVDEIGCGKICKVSEEELIQVVLEGEIL